MIRRVVLLLALASCSVPPSTQPKPDVSAALPASVCRAGPDGGIPVAERGIGGTGIADDRGIGGTGVVADRGIGGTGIVGVITGFASICLAGQEVPTPPDLPVTIDGRPGTLAALRVGQVAVVQAGGARPVATSLALRHEVSGPFEGVEADGALRVAGQRVLPPKDTPLPSSGAWVLVSGFRRSDGTVVATRLDPRGPGEVLIRGTMVAAAGRLRIGVTEIRPAPGQFRQAGVPVTAVGRLRDGVLLADTVEPDALLVDPVRYFGPAVGVLIVEGYAERGFVRFGPGLRYAAPFAEGRALTRLERGPAGFAPATMREGPRGFAPAPRAGFDPAPMPNRAFDRDRGRLFEGPGAVRPGGRRDRGPPPGGASPALIRPGPN